MTFTITIPDWGVWTLCGMLAISAAVNIWHGVTVRNYMRRSGS